MKFKTDRYKRARGGSARLLEISCQKCGSSICLYQKDGTGTLRRMYVDRIIEPKVPISGKHLICSEGHVVGATYIYEKEGRAAYRLSASSVAKKIATFQ